ncbi:trypsin-like serine protease [Streptomyces sp. ISL-1]|uniref:trypsin-like serine protease n=1 Tax=Streptomyces sp. ISL-1 TaxID=2817657 RepID=UPI0027E49D33|nr:trypsin-like serine protease [Streptomyces sp. ISL-1]
MSELRPRAASTAVLVAVVAAAGVLTGTSAQAVAGAPASDASYAFTAKLDIGDGDQKRSCSGALVSPQWVATASSCFADDPAQPGAVGAGRPKLKTVATVGRADLSGTGGVVSEVVELVPREGRDLVMARLASPVTGVNPVALATTAPAPGEELRVAGYGRTKEAWLPNNLHTAAFTVTTVASTSLDIDGKSATDAICKGDTGGPTFREKGGKAELVAVNSRSWQGGCFGESETRTGAVATRLDDVNSWIQKTRLTNELPTVTDVMTSADFNGDGRTDIAAVLTDGSLHAFYAGPDGTLEYGRNLWKDNGWKTVKKIIGGDFNGDGKADIAAITGAKALLLYPGTSNTGTLGESRKMWHDNSWTGDLPVTRFKSDTSGRDALAVQAADGGLLAYTSRPDGVLTSTTRQLWPDKTWTKKVVAGGDFNQDGWDDIVALATDGNLHLYKGNAKGTLDAASSLWPDKSWAGMKAVHVGDVNGDGKSDLIGRQTTSNNFFWYAGDGSGNLALGKTMWPTVSTTS